MVALRKYYPGDLRKTGEKEYAVILSKLISYSKKFEKDYEIKSQISILKKIIEKLVELGFKRDASKIKTYMKSERLIEKNKSKIIDIALSAWDIGIEKHKIAKTKKKS